MFYKISNNITPRELNAPNKMMAEFQKSDFGATLVPMNKILFSTYTTQHSLNSHELRATKKINKRRKKCKPAISEDSLNTT